MSSDLVWRFIGCLVPLIGSAIQMLATLLKRSNWISRAEREVSPLGRPFVVLDKLPLRLSYALLLAVLLLSLLALAGGIGMVSGHSPFGLLNYLFANSLWLTLAFLVLAVATYFNVLSRLLLAISRAGASLDRDLTYNPGWINAYWHVSREDDAVPINTDLAGCELVANGIVRAVALHGVAYDLDRATKPDGLSRDELANFLVIANAIESEIHLLKLGRDLPFADLYRGLGEVGLRDERPFSPTTLVSLSSEHLSLYQLLRRLVHDLPDEPALDARITELLTTLVRKYSGRALKLGEAVIGTGFDGAALDRRLGRLSAFANSQAMRAQVIKLGTEWNVWAGMPSGPFIYPFTKNIARLLFNLDCLRTRPDVRSISCDEEFKRLSAWTMDRIVDNTMQFLRETTDDRVVSFCAQRFGCPARDVQRWPVSREVDYFLWVQARSKHPEGGIFGASAATPWAISGNNLVRG